MQERCKKEDGDVLCYLAKREDLAEKKAKIYSRLLTEPALAQEMEALAKRHAERKMRLETLATGKEPKKEEENEA